MELLKELTKLTITDFQFESLKNMGDLSGYDFSIIKLTVFLENVNSEDNKETKTDVYIKMIRKDKIKESIFCYWSLLYEEKFKDYEESEFTSVVSKVRITETESEKYKHSVLLEIKENKWGILEYGSNIHLVKLAQYLNDKTITKPELLTKWKKYIEEDNQDVLFIGIVNKAL